MLTALAISSPFGQIEIELEIVARDSKNETNSTLAKEC